MTTTATPPNGTNSLERQVVLALNAAGGQMPIRAVRALPGLASFAAISQVVNSLRSRGIVHVGVATKAGGGKTLQLTSAGRAVGRVLLSVAGGPVPHGSAAPVAPNPAPLGITINLAAPPAQSPNNPATMPAVAPGAGAGGTGAFHTGGMHRVPGGTVKNPNQAYHYEVGAAPGALNAVMGARTPNNSTLADPNGVPLSMAGAGLAASINIAEAQGNRRRGGMAGLGSPTGEAELLHHGYAATMKNGDVHLTHAGVKAIEHAGQMSASQANDWKNAQTGAPATSLVSPTSASAIRQTPTNETASGKKAYDSAFDAQQVINTLVAQHAAVPGLAADVIAIDPGFQKAIADLRKTCIALNSQYANARNPKYAKGGVVNPQFVAQAKQELDHYRGLRDIVSDAAVRGLGLHAVFGSTVTPAQVTASHQSLLQQPAPAPAPPAMAPPAPAVAPPLGPTPMANWSGLRQHEQSLLLGLHAAGPDSSGRAVALSSPQYTGTSGQADSDLQSLMSQGFVTGKPALPGSQAALGGAAFVYSLTPKGSLALSVGATMPPPAVAPPPAPTPSPPPAAPNSPPNLLPPGSPGASVWAGLGTDEQDILSTMGTMGGPAPLSSIVSAHGAISTQNAAAAIANLKSSGDVTGLANGGYALTPSGQALANHGLALQGIAPAPPAPPPAAVTPPPSQSTSSPAPAHVAQYQALSSQEQSALGLLSSHGPMTPGQLSKRPGIGVPALQARGILKSLLAGGLVHMASGTGMSANYALTSTGTSVLAAGSAPAPAAATAPAATPSPSSTATVPAFTPMSMTYDVLDSMHRQGKNTPMDAASIAAGAPGYAAGTAFDSHLGYMAKNGFLTTFIGSSGLPYYSMTPGAISAFGAMQAPGATLPTSTPLTPATPAPPPTPTLTPQAQWSALSTMAQGLLTAIQGSPATNANSSVHYLTITAAAKANGLNATTGLTQTLLSGLAGKGLVTIGSSGNTFALTPFGSQVIAAGAPPPAPVVLPPTAPTLTPDEQRVLNMMTASRKAAAGIHFDSIRTSSTLKQNGQMITGTALLPILQSLQQKGLVNTHSKSAGKGPKASYWIPTGMAGSTSVATPHATPGAPGTNAPTGTFATQTPSSGGGSFNAPPPGTYRVGPNSSYIQYGAAAGRLPGAPVYTTAIRAGRSTLPLNLNDMGPAAGSQPYQDAAKYPDRNHADKFGMAYQGPTGAVITVVHGQNTGMSTIPGSTVSGLRPGNANMHGYGLYSFAGRLQPAIKSGYCSPTSNDPGVAYEIEFHSGRVIDTNSTGAVVAAWKKKNPKLYQQLAHDRERQKAAACLDAGFSAISMNYSGSPAYVILDPTRCRIKSVFDAKGNPHKLPNGQMSPPPSKSVMASGKDTQKHWTGLPDLAAAKDPTMVARNAAIGASPTVPLSDNGAAIIGRIYKSQGGKMSKAAIGGARDVSSVIRPVRGVANPNDLLTIMDSDSLISGAELQRRIAAAKSDTSAAGKAAYAKLTSVSANNNPDDKTLGLDDSVFLTYGSPTTYNSYGPISIVYKPEVLNTPGTKVNLHGVNCYNGGGSKPVDVQAWKDNEIDGMEASEVMAFQLAAKYPVTNGAGKLGTAENGGLSSPDAYLQGHTLTAKEQAEVHVPTSVSHHMISHVLIPAGTMVTLPGSKQNAIDPHWNVAPGLHDRLVTSSGAGRRADVWQQNNNGVDGQSLMLDGQPLTLRHYQQPDGSMRWQFEVPVTSNKTVHLKDHLESLFKKKGLDVQVIETQAKGNSPHGQAVNYDPTYKTFSPAYMTHASTYEGICYGSL